MTTSAGSRRSTSASKRRARATCRCARRNRSAARLDDLDGRIDLVLIDAPCTGTGAWRRNPDAKWRMRPGALEQRQKEQAEVARPRRAAGQARRPHRLRHLLGAGRGERRPGARLPRPPPGVSRSPPAERDQGALGERAFMFGKAARLSDGGPTDDAAHDRAPTASSFRCCGARKAPLVGKMRKRIPRLRRIPGPIPPR